MDTSALERGVSQMTSRLHSALFAVGQNYAQQVQSYARSNAPWNDQTGNARNGLFGDASRVGESHVITLYHTMPYGVWLEIRNSGRYEIINPTIQLFGPRVMAHVRGLIGRM